MEFRLLGPLEVLEGGRLLDLGAPRERALLTLLLLNSNQIVSRDRIVEELWPEGAPRTAPKVVQVYVAHLRKALGRDRERLASRSAGYALQVRRDELDLGRFENLVARASREEPAARAQTLREALALWRGRPLDEFSPEAFVRAEVARLEELHLLALEERIDADLDLGRDAELVPELELLVDTNPLRERLRGQLMLALYRAGRQADALAAFRDGRRVLVDQLGLEPGNRLRSLEAAILRQDESLEASSGHEQRRAILVVTERHAALDALLALAEPLTSGPTKRRLVVAETLSADELAGGTAALVEVRAGLIARNVDTQVAAFTTSTLGLNAARLARLQDADLLLTSAAGDPFAGNLAAVFEEATCDVAVLHESGGPPATGPVVVPFGAFEHDWAALELGVWIATVLERPLQLIGAADDRPNGADASRLLADASLVVQHTSGIVPEPLLARRGHKGIREQAADAGLLVVGLSDRWRSEGLGVTRSALAMAPPAPLVFVRRGIRPGGMAPDATLTRFTWSFEQPTIGTRP